MAMKTTFPFFRAVLSLFLLLLGAQAFAQCAPCIQVDHKAGTVYVTGSPGIFAGIAAITSIPHDGKGIAIFGESTDNAAIVGNSVNSDGIFGSTVSGNGGRFATYGSGIALHAVRGSWSNGIALRVDGPMVKPRQPRNLVRFFDPRTGKLVGEFEFEYVQLPP